MSLLRSIVVDDEPLARELVEGYVNQTPFLESAGSYPDALSAMEAIRNGMQAELLFLDIQMPNLSGLELSRLLPPEMKVIFITAFEQYAVEGFRVEALDYLLKPVSYADFLSAAQKAQRQFELERGAVKANVFRRGTEYLRKNRLQNRPDPSGFRALSGRSQRLCAHSYG